MLSDKINVFDLYYTWAICLLSSLIDFGVCHWIYLIIRNELESMNDEDGRILILLFILYPPLSYICCTELSSLIIASQNLQSWDIEMFDMKTHNMSESFEGSRSWVGKWTLVDRNLITYPALLSDHSCISVSTNNMYRHNTMPLFFVWNGIQFITLASHRLLHVTFFSYFVNFWWAF